MEMEVEFSGCTVSGDTAIVVGRFVVQLSEIEERGKIHHFEHGSLAQEIKSLVAKEIADEYLEVNRMGLVNAIQLKEIVDGIQLKVVEGFSLNPR